MRTPDKDFELRPGESPCKKRSPSISDPNPVFSAVKVDACAVGETARAKVKGEK